MALQKQNISINFAQGLDLKTDPFQVGAGKFLSLENSIFDKAGRLTKRNGYSALTTLPNTSSTLLTTFNNNLIAVGTNIEALSTGSETWVNKGAITPVDLKTLPLYRSNLNQSQADTIIASNGLACTVFTETGNVHKYVISDSLTGQNIVAPVIIPSDPTLGTPRVFLLGNYFVILYTTLVTATYHLVYIAVSVVNPTNVTAPSDIASAYVPSDTLAFDGLVVDSYLYIAYNTLSGGQSIKVTALTSNLTLLTPKTYAGEIGTLFTLCVDNTNSTSPIIWVSYYDLPTTTGKALAIDKNLNAVLAPTSFASSGTLLNLASTAINGSVTIYAEVNAVYGYDSSLPTHYIRGVSVAQDGTVGSTAVVVRSVGLASKAFLIDGTSYFLGVYFSAYQPTYFLLNGSGKVIAKLAYANARDYYTAGLPGVTINDNVIKLAYFYKDLIQAVNRTQGVTNSAGVYSQTGINLVTFTVGGITPTTAEIGGTLNFSGGFLTSYDGYVPVEQNFFLYPDNVEGTVILSGGAMTDQTYFYQVTYEWADNQGNTYRSTPSIPLKGVISGGGGAASVVLHIPTLRLTYKTADPVRIVIYRWSTAQQTYYQVTSFSNPELNNMAVDYVDHTDTAADSSILGNNILYTNGGVIEDIGPPAFSTITLFNNRLWGVDSEDRNLLWFSKQVIEATPVEMSDLLTMFIAPTTASQGSTGHMTALSPMDDKLIIFKANALGYIQGIGPDNTGSNNQYSDFTLINSVVGCTNQKSIVFMPRGLMFQSAKGIWLLGRDLSTEYIGAPVETITTGATVQSAVNVPGTTQVRFTLDTGVTLMYDYFFGQWGTFTNVPAISSTIYNNLHTYLNSLGQVLQESPGSYIDNTSPVLMSFQTSWFNLAGVQGYERFYQMYLLGQYLTPFKLNVGIAFDYAPSPSQYIMVTPDNVPSTWGSESLWGSGGNWGGSSNIFEARVFPTRQKCESFQISISEVYDATLGVAAGAGLTLSGLNLIAGLKRGFRTSAASKNFG